MVRALGCSEAQLAKARRDMAMHSVRNMVGLLRGEGIGTVSTTNFILLAGCVKYDAMLSAS